MEKRFEVKTYLVKKYCECGGEMIYGNNSFVLPCYPPRYPHQCNKCGATDSYIYIYPKMEYEEIK